MFSKALGIVAVILLAIVAAVLFVLFVSYMWRELMHDMHVSRSRKLSDELPPSSDWSAWDEYLPPTCIRNFATDRHKHRTLRGSRAGLVSMTEIRE